MKKPQYELAPLRKAVTQCQTNIQAFREGITKEETRMDELQVYIKEWEDYNRSTDGDPSQSNG